MILMYAVNINLNSIADNKERDQFNRYQLSKSLRKLLYSNTSHICYVTAILSLITYQ